MRKRTITTAITGGSIGLAVAGVGVTVFATPLMACVGLALFGAGTGMCDVAMNVEGAANERVLGRTVMPLFHAAFSVGTVTGAALGALAELAGVAVAVHLGSVAVVIVVTAVRARPSQAAAPSRRTATPVRCHDDVRRADGAVGCRSGRTVARS